MRPIARKFLAASLLCTTAAVPAAFAQQNQGAAAQGQDPAGLQGCENLARITDENANRFDREWINDANGVVRRGDDERCDAWSEQAELALDRAQQRRAQRQQAQGAQAGQGQNGADREQADGSRIIVQQPEPRVTVQQDAPEITVDQARPQVQVSQGRPEIIVRQQRPTVTVDMPRPTITIDQPEPQIIVRMPEPDVQVQLPEPDIQVSQDEPQVRVQQGEPQVRVQMDEPDVRVQGDREAQVQIERGQPIVRQQAEEEQAQVRIQRGEPLVRYEKAEPRVQFNQQGEPRVRFTQSGEPQVRVERQQADAGQSAASQRERQAMDDRAGRRDGEQAAAQGEPQPLSGDREANVRNRMQAANRLNEDAAANREAGNDDQSWNGRQTAALRENGQQVPAGKRGQIAVADLVGKDVVNANDVELGTVERVVRDGNRYFVVLERGGFLGIGDREVALPLDRISMRGENGDLLMRGMTEEDIESMPEFDVEQVQPIRQNQQVPVSSL